jgi:hypothetical protein
LTEDYLRIGVGEPGAAVPQERAVVTGTLLAEGAHLYIDLPRHPSRISS